MTLLAGAAAQRHAGFAVGGGDFGSLLNKEQSDTPKSRWNDVF
jgi:hypothetical protein